MARKNLFRDLVEDTAGERPPAQPTRLDFPATKPMQRMNESLLDLHRSAIQDVPVDRIRDSRFADRIDVEEGLDALVESFREIGQEVPIKVRPLKPDGYEVVAGRRRLRAARTLSWPTIKAMVVDLDDAAALVALGAENAGRLEVSFIGRARLAHDVYTQEEALQPVLARALGVTQQYVSRMLTIYGAVGDDVVRAIGDAPGIGWRRWERVIELAKALGLDKAALAARVDPAIETSTDRFNALIKALEAENAARSTSARFQSVRKSVLDGQCVLTRKANGLEIKGGRRCSPALLDRIQRAVEKAIEDLEAEDTVP